MVGRTCWDCGERGGARDNCVSNQILAGGEYIRVSKLSVIYTCTYNKFLHCTWCRLVERSILWKR